MSVKSPSADQPAEKGFLVLKHRKVKPRPNYDYDERDRPLLLLLDGLIVLGVAEFAFIGYQVSKSVKEACDSRRSK